MKFTKTLRALLVLGLFQQADSQGVTVTIGESGTNVFMEFSGSLAGFPPPFNTQSTFPSFFISDFGPNSAGTYVSAATQAFQCKCCTDVSDK